MKSDIYFLNFSLKIFKILIKYYKTQKSLKDFNLYNYKKHLQKFYIPLIKKMNHKKSIADELCLLFPY